MYMMLVFEKEECMELFAAMMNVIQTAIIAIGVGLSLYGGINLMEGYGGDNPASKSQGIKQVMAK